MNDQGAAKTLRLCRETEDHSRENLAEVAKEINHTRRIYDWAYVNCVTAYYDIHGLWLAVNSDGHMLGHGTTKLEAFEKAQADRYARHEHSEDVRRFSAACFMNGGNQ